MTCQEANRDIVMILIEEIENQPNTRFSQLMRNIGVVQQITLADGSGKCVWTDEFNMESDSLLKRIKSMRT